MVDLPGGGFETEVFFSDLGHEYVTDQRGIHDLRELGSPMHAPVPAPDVATLLEALPYIRDFHGRTVVIKYGGAAMEDPALREEFARDVVLLKYVGMNPVVVHGGGPEITGYMERLGMPVEFIGGLRVSDEATVEVAKMVLVGKVNKDIVLRLSRHGQPAVGLCGDDGSLFRVDARRRRPAARTSASSGASSASTSTCSSTSPSDYIPVVASVGADREGNSYNVNADEAAGAVARALRRLQGDLPDRRRGLARATRPTRSSVVSEAGADEVPEALDGVTGGMRPKLAGVRRRDPRRRHVRAHRRRPRAALAAARAVHRRRHRHEDPAAMSLSELQALER